MMGNVTGIDPEDMEIGAAVDVDFVQADEGVAVPFWRPTTTASAPTRTSSSP